MTQVQSYNGGDWVTTRTDSITGQSFDVSMQEEQSLNGGAHATETIGWFAIDSGTENDGDTILEGGITGNSFNHDPSAGSFSASFNDAPALIAKLGSYRGGDPASLRTTEISTSGFKALVHEEQSADKEKKHIKESIHFLALDSSFGALEGDEYSSQSSSTSSTTSSTSTSSSSSSDSSSIGEYGTLSLNHNWQTVSFNNQYTNPVVIVSDPSFNGGDPGNIRIKIVG